MTPREILISRIKRRGYYIVTTDFGCPGLDGYKNLINAGIAEQNAILIACGMALEKKTVFVYGICAFITMRCLDQIRVYMAGMKLPVTIIGVGRNDEYRDAGFTHWSFHDAEIMEKIGVKVEEIHCNDEADSVDLIYSGPRYLRVCRFDDKTWWDS